MRTAAVVVAATLIIASTPARGQDADVRHLTALASRWTARFEQGLSGLLFRERYLQRVEGVSARSAMSRASIRQREVLLEANVFLLRPEGVDEFVLFRDVYARDGIAQGDHTARLEALLLDGTRDAIAQARALTNASAAYNVGPVTRNVNIPTMGLAYLEPARLAGVRFEHVGREVINGLDTVILAFEETARPTFVRGTGDTDVPARGRYWVHPGSGAVPRARLELTGNALTGRMDVEFALHDTLAVWVPLTMTERWRALGQGTTGLATYDRFQRLTVSTGEIVK